MTKLNDTEVAAVDVAMTSRPVAEFLRQLQLLVCIGIMSPLAVALNDAPLLTVSVCRLCIFSEGKKKEPPCFNVVVVLRIPSSFSQLK